MSPNMLLGGLADDVRLFDQGDGGVAVYFCVLEGAAYNAAAPFAGEDTAGDGNVLRGHTLEGGHAGAVCF
jgi:hypothetical protein